MPRLRQRLPLLGGFSVGSLSPCRRMPTTISCFSRARSMTSKKLRISPSLLHAGVHAPPLC